MPLGKRTDYGDAKFAGVEVPFSCDIVDTIQVHLQCGFDFIAAPLVHPRYRRPAPSRLPKGHVPPLAFTRSDLLLSSSQWSGQVVGKVSAWIDPDSPAPHLACDSQAAFLQELGWAAHLGLQAIILPAPPQGLRSVNYAQLINRALAGLSHMAVWIRIPLSPQEDPGSGADSASIEEAPTARENDPWEWWQQLRVLCESHSLLGVVLDVGPQLPSPALVDRWRGEPVRALCVHTSTYTSNKRGYPVLPKRHQEVLATFFAHNCQVILSGNSHHQPPSGATAGPDHEVSSQTLPGGQTLAGAGNGTVITPQVSQHPLYPYWEYLCFLFRRMPAVSEQELLELRYRDYLQAPLQPLQDNLESQTYETFEKDVTKYETYGEAVYRALLDRVPEEEAATKTTLLMVVGAGRGPLVRASLRAAERAGRLLRVFAVEKNPNAVVTLQNLVVSEGWEAQVTIVSSDMRVWEAPEQADILVSELLGSFGDNELSPECLDGAQRFLKPGGISIPSSYTSFMAPVTTAKLYDSVKTYKDLEHLETPYVVKFHNHHLLAETQPVFTFHHPNHADVIDNTRSVRLEYKRQPEDLGAVLHGFAGYFEAVLYKDVLLSTHPPTHTPNMFSWFPIYFPLQDPVYIPAGATIVAHMWRCSAAHKVWYEWAISQPTTTPIHNSNGRSYYVGL